MCLHHVDYSSEAFLLFHSRWRCRSLWIRSCLWAGTTSSRCWSSSSAWHGSSSMLCMTSADGAKTGSQPVAAASGNLTAYTTWSVKSRNWWVSEVIPKGSRVITVHKHLKYLIQEESFDLQLLFQWILQKCDHISPQNQRGKNRDFIVIQDNTKLF